MVKQAQYNLRPIFSEVFNDYQSFYKNGCFLDQTTQNASIQNGKLVRNPGATSRAGFGTKQILGYATNVAFRLRFKGFRLPSATGYLISLPGRGVITVSTTGTFSISGGGLGEIFQDGELITQLVGTDEETELVINYNQPSGNISGDFYFIQAANGFGLCDYDECLFVEVYDTNITKEEANRLLKGKPVVNPIGIKPKLLNNIEGLIAAYNFNGQDILPKDITGNGYDMIDGNNYQLSNKGIHFSGVGYVYNVGLHNELSFNKTWSILFIVDTKSLFSTEDLIINTGVSTSDRIAIGLDPGGHICVSTYDGATTNGKSYNLGGAINGRYNIMVTCDGSGPEGCSIYVDEEEGTENVLLSSSGEARFVIGQRNNLINNRTYRGRMEYMEVYNQVKSLDFHKNFLTRIR